MDAEEDPDPGAVHPTLFYGLWPRFSADEAEDAASAEPAAGLAE